MTTFMTNSAAWLGMCGLLALVTAAPAPAQNAKSWVANDGADGNPCTLALPCATFQRAHNQTNPGGEIGVLTPGDYGGATTPRLAISKSIHITNDGTGEASILAPATAVGISISAANGDIVSLRGLVIDGQGTGSQGIAFFRGSALHVQNCVIRNFLGVLSVNFGIEFVPSGVSSQLFVSDTIVFNNGSNAGTGGILVQPQDFGGQPGVANVVLDRVRLENNVEGLSIVGSFTTGTGAHVVLRDSIMSGNVGNGIRALTTAGHAPAFALVERVSTINNAQSGIRADGAGATILLKESTITRNGTGVTTVNSGQLISYGSNTNNNNLGAEGVATGFFSAF